MRLETMLHCLTKQKTPNKPCGLGLHMASLYVRSPMQTNSKHHPPTSTTTTNLAIALHTNCKENSPKTKHNDDSGSAAVTRELYTDSGMLVPTQENMHTTEQTGM